MKDKILLYLTAVTVLLLLGWTIHKEASIQGVGYIDIGKLVDGYEFKKDMEKQAGKNLSRVKHTIDSLEMLQKATAAPGPSRVDSQLRHAKYVFEQYYTASNRDISKQVWDRLNPIIEQYGKERNLELLIGANGAGTLLYATKKRDMTDDLLQYINRKYEKGN